MSPITLLSDREGALRSEGYRSYLQTKKVNLGFLRQPGKAYLAEIAIRWLRRRIAILQAMEGGPPIWTRFFQRAVKSYNTIPKRRLANQTPEEGLANRPPFREKLRPLIVGNLAKLKELKGRSVAKGELEVDMVVQVRLKERRFQKGSALPSVSPELFKIAAIRPGVLPSTAVSRKTEFSLPYYRLKSLTEERILGAVSLQTGMPCSYLLLHLTLSYFRLVQKKADKRSASVIY